MIPILTIDAVRAAEALADANGIPYAEMMQRAGRVLAERAKRHLTGLPGGEQPRVTVLVGPGNNGGDGLVAGTILAAETPALVRFYLTKARDETDPVFKPVLDAGLFHLAAADDQRQRVLFQLCASAHVIIDALYGIGTTPPLRADAGKLLRVIHQALGEPPAAPPFVTLDDVPPPAPRPIILACDCPSGVHCDTGEADAQTLTADETVTFIAPKTGLLLSSGASYAGRLTVASLGLDPTLAPFKEANAALVDAASVRDMLPARPVDGHKGTFGKALIAGGSLNYMGAPGLAALAAYRAGAGLVTVAAPEAVAAALAARLLETTWIVLPEEDGVIASGAARVLAVESAGYQALLVGPGLTHERAARAFLLQLLAAGDTRKAPPLGFVAAQAAKSADRPALPPLVLDADALNILAETDEWPALLPAETVLTPHPAEMARLSGLDTAAVQANRWKLAREKAELWRCVLVLKGAHTVIAASDGRLAVLPFKTSALAKAGSGDVLGGIITGLRAGGLAAFEAAVCGAYLHGLAGVVAGEQLGARAPLVTDVLDTLPHAVQRLEAR